MQILHGFHKDDARGRIVGIAFGEGEIDEEGEEEHQEGYCLIADDASATRTDCCIGNVVDDIEHTQDARQQQHGNTQYQVPRIEQGIESG